MRIRLEPRGRHSPVWTWGSPILALLLTLVTAAVADLDPIVIKVRHS